MSLRQKVTGGGLASGFLFSAANSGLIVVPAPYDSMLYNNPAIGVVATVTFPATAGMAWVLAAYTGVYDGTGPLGASIPYLQILDGATILWSNLLGLSVLAAGAVASNLYTISNVAYKSSVGASLTVRFNGITPGYQQSVSAAAYLI